MTYSNSRLKIKDAALAGGVATFIYHTGETTAEVDAVDYFADGGDFGMKQGDIVYVQAPNRNSDLVNLHRIVTINGRAATSQWFGQASSSVLSENNSELMRAFDPAYSGSVGAAVQNIAATSITITNAHHGRMLNFTAATAVTVTVPADLRADFSCGFSQGGAGLVTFQAGAGATINAAGGGLTSVAQYVVGGLTAFAKSAFRLYRHATA